MGFCWGKLKMRICKEFGCRKIKVEAEQILNYYQPLHLMVLHLQHFQGAKLGDPFGRIYGTGLSIKKMTNIT